MSDQNPGANKMWGGRFTTAPADVMRRINPSIGFDYRLYRQDIAASKTHAAMLARQGIIAGADNERIQAGLDQIRGEIDRGELQFSIDLEDIHMNVEARLKAVSYTHLDVYKRQA